MEREVMKEEAVKRMKKLELHYNAIRDFSKKDKDNKDFSEFGTIAIKKSFGGLVRVC